jgi:uncharacterized protein (TIGR02246 family)
VDLYEHQTFWSGRQNDRHTSQDFKFMAQPRVTRSLAAIATATTLLSTAGTSIGVADCFPVPTLAQQKEETGESQMSAEGRSYDVSRQLDEKIEKYDEAINRNDAAAVAFFFTDDAVFVTSGGPLCGRGAIEKQYGEWFKQWHHSNHLEKKDSDSLRIVGTADNIAVNGEWSGTDQQGEASVQLNGYWSAIYVRVGNTWKIRWLTYNVSPAPATAITAAASDAAVNTICPVSGDRIVSFIGKPQYAQYEGKNIAVCCNECLTKFQQNPAKYGPLALKNDSANEPMKH